MKFRLFKTIKDQFFIGRDLFRRRLARILFDKERNCNKHNLSISRGNGKKFLEDEKGQTVLLASFSKKRNGQLLSEKKLCEALCCERRNGSFLIKLFWDWRSGRVFAEPLTIFSENGCCGLRVKREEAFEEDEIWINTLSKKV